MTNVFSILDILNGSGIVEDLIMSKVFTGSMPIIPPESIIREYGSEFINGMASGQKIKWKDTTYLGVHILEEAEPTGSQRLITEDIMGELDKVPEKIRKYIQSIVLSPFNNEYDSYYCKRRGREGPSFASADFFNGQITIYALPIDRSVLKSALSEHPTLSHEAGHIIDFQIQPIELGFFAYSPRWSKAICEDNKVMRTRQDLTTYLVSPNAEEVKSLREDFADSVMFFSDDGCYKEFLRENYPNRYKILEELIGNP